MNTPKILVIFLDGVITPTTIKCVSKDICEPYVYDGCNGYKSNIKQFQADLANYKSNQNFLMLTNIPEFMNFATYEKDTKHVYLYDAKRLIYGVNISHFTDKEIREGHNIAKMYMNGVFDDEE